MAAETGAPLLSVRDLKAYFLQDEGTVKEVLVAEGQAVSEGDTLVVLE